MPVPMKIIEDFALPPPLVQSLKRSPVGQRLCHCAVVALAVGLVLSIGKVRAQTTVYWDTNSNTAGSSGSATAGGTWDQNATANWTTVSDGTGSTGTWQTKSGGSGIATFSAGTNATGSFTVNVSGTVTGIQGITFEEGTATLSGGTLTLGATSNIDTGAQNATISSVIAGTGLGINKLGSGSLTLSGTNTYTGTTTIGGGTLQVGAGGTTGSVAGDILNNGTLTFDRSNAATYGGVISGSGQVNQSGTGTLILTGNNTYTGTTTINSGTLQIGANGTTGSVAGNIVNNGSLVFSRTNTVTYAGNISGTGGVSATSSTASNGENNRLTLILQGNNSFAGTINVTASSLILDSTGALPSAPAIVLNDDGYVGYTESTGLSFSGFKSAITSSGSDISSDTIIGVDSHNGASPRNVSETIDLSNLGTVYFGTATNVTVSGPIISPSGGNLYLTGVNGGYLKVTSALTAGANGIGNLTIGNNETEPGDVTYKGYVELTNASGNYTGTSGLQSGYLLVGASSTLSGSTITGPLGNSTLTVSGTADTGAPALAASVNGLTLHNNIVLSTTLQVGVPTTATPTDFAYPLQAFAANSLTLAGTISGSSGLDYEGSGTLTLTGTNTYTGSTTIGAGILSVGNLAIGGSNSSIGKSANAATNLVLNGGTLKYTGATTSTDRLFTLGINSGTLDASGSGLITFSNTGSVAFTSTASHTLSLGGSGSGSLAATIADNTGLTALTKIGAGTWTLSGANSYSGVTTISGGILSVGTVANGGTSSGIGAATSMVQSLVIDGGTLQFTGSTDQSTNHLFTIGSGGATIDASGTGALSLNNTNNLAVAGSTTHSLTLTGSNTGANTLSPAIVDNGVLATSLTKSGAGNWMLSGANTFTGTTTISAGTLTLGNALALQNSTLTAPASGGLSFGTLTSATLGGLTGSNNLALTNASSAPVALSVGNNNGNTTYSGMLSGSGSLTKVGTGTLILSTANNYTGTTTLNNGILAISQDSNLGPAPGSATAGSLVFNGGTLENTATFTLASNRGISLGASGGTFSTDPNTTLSYGGIIADSGALTKLGTGLLVLSGTNTYAGSTTISAGTLQLGSNTTLPSATDVNLNGSGAILDVNGKVITVGSIAGVSGTSISLGNGSLATSGNLSATFSGVISGNGPFTKGGTGTLWLSGNNTFTGTTTISGGTLKLTNSLALAGSTVNYNGGGTLSFGIGFGVGAFTLGGLSGAQNLTLVNSPDNSYPVTLTVGANNQSTTYSGILSDGTYYNNSYGNSSVTKVGTGTLTLTGPNTYAGGTMISAGTLSIGNGGSIAGNVTDNATLTFAHSDAYAFGGAISGTGQVNQTGPGTLTLSGANSYSGATTINGGVLAISQDSNLGGVPGSPTLNSLTLNGGTLETTATFPLNAYRDVAIGISGGTINTDPGTTLTYAGPISGSNLTKTGTGTLVLSGASSYAGTNINAGTLQLASTGSLSTGSDITLNGSGTFDVFANQTIRDLISSSATSNVIIENGVTLNSNMPNTNPGNLSTYAGSLSGAGSFLKNGGVSTLILTGNSSLTGLTTVSSGTLQIGNNGTTGSISGNIAITNPGTLDFNRSDVPSSPITYSSVLSGNGTFVKDGASTLIISNPANTFSGSATINAGALVVGADNVVPNATVTVNSGGNFTVSNNATINSLSGTGTTTVASGKALTLSGVSTLSSIISGLGGVTFGSGINVVANQAYTGVTSIPSGVLIIGNSTATGTIAGNIATNPSSSIPSSVNVQNAGPSTYAGIISGAGSLSLNGPGNLTLTGVNTYSGLTSVNGGVLIAGVDNAVPNGSVSVGTNGTFSVANNETISSLSGSGMTTVAANKTLTLGGAPLSAVISGAGNVAINGVVTVTSNQTYLGNTVLNDTGNNLTLNLGNNTTSGMVAGNIVTTTAKTGVQFNRSNDVTYGGVISGGGFLNKNNTNTLTLTGQNTYTGGTNITAGTLTIGTTNALPTSTILSITSILDVAANQVIAGFNSSAFTSTIKIESGKTFNVTLGNSAFGTVFAGTITDGTTPGGALEIGSNNGNGHTLGLYGNNTYTGGTTIDAGGALLLGSNGTTGSILGNVIDNGALIFNRSNTTTFSGVISGNGSVSEGVLAGTTTGDVKLTGNNTYTGGTNVNSRTLIVGDGATSGSIVGNVNLSNNATLALARSDNTSFGGVVSGAGSFFKAGTGTLTLTSQNSYTGYTYVGNSTVSGGTLVLGVANALPTTTLLSIATNASAVLDVLHNQTVAGFLTPGDLTSVLQLDPGATFTVAMPVANTSTTFAGTVNGTGTFAVSGAGGDVVNLTGSVASTVGTSVGTGATLNIASGGTLGGPIALNTGSILTLNNVGAQTFTNVISGAGTLLASAGTTTLTAPNLYTGGTVINGGKVIVSNTSGSATGTGSVIVNSGGILGGSGIITGTLVLNSGGTVSPGNSPGSLAVGATTFAGGAIFAFDINSSTGTPGTNWDLLTVTGPLVISATSSNPFVINLNSLNSGNNPSLLSNFDPTQPYSWQFVSTTGGITGFSAGAFQYNASQFQNSLGGGIFVVSQTGNNLFLNFSPVPEPSTWALLATGLGLLALAAQRRRRS